ncbi:MAG: membrane protein insertase YidC [Gammaproteobacteria bacterium]|nr:MAG: membrane protein insertase YidC [Gammaproteobacteria bacterium]
MLDYVRIALYTLLIVVGFFLFQAWQAEHPKAELPAVTPTSSPQAVPGTHFVPQTATATTQPAALLPPPATGQLVTVQTDVLAVSIDTHGGDIVEAKLLGYPESLHSKTPFTLLNNDPKSRYVAESGLLSPQGPDTADGQAVYTTSQTTYTLDPNQNELVVKLNWQNPQGLTVTKVFTFTRHSYEIKLAYDIDNKTTQPWTGNPYTQLLRTNTPPPTHGGFVNLATYFGAAVSTPQKAFQKLSFKDMAEKPFNQTAPDGWAAMIQHYFISAWIPPQNDVSTFYTNVTPNGLYTVGMTGPQLNVAPGQTLSHSAKLYIGPTIADLLEKTAPHLQLTIDYGWFWFISIIIFWMMQKIYDVVGNWGWSIVLVTIVIKLLFYKLSAKSYRSMSKLKKLQPRIEQLRERLGDDKQKLTQATLELYRQEKVNPMTGCLPILIQIPVFIALYWVLVESVQLRQAPFIFWIHDLSQQDPYYILPLLMGLSMFIQQRLNPPPPDPLQAKIMMLMPVIFTVLFANFPSGLMLYWFVNNTLSFMQQWFIMRSIEKEGNEHRRK